MGIVSGEFGVVVLQKERVESARSGYIGLSIRKNRVSFAKSQVAYTCLIEKLTRSIRRLDIKCLSDSFGNQTLYLIGFLDIIISQGQRKESE